MSLPLGFASWDASSGSSYIKNAVLRSAQKQEWQMTPGDVRNTFDVKTEMWAILYHVVMWEQVGWLFLVSHLHEHDDGNVRFASPNVWMKMEQKKWRNILGKNKASSSFEPNYIYLQMKCVTLPR